MPEAATPSTGDRVSVVIPTRNRTDLLARAIETVLAQTHTDLEVVVVIDGPDGVTLQKLESIDDRRLRWLVNETSLGGAEARNVGVRAASGRWIAFLDDDDEWLPTKLERQLQLMAGATQPAAVSCRIVTHTPKRTFIGPPRAPRPDEPLSEYLFRPRRPFARGARLQTSAMLVSRELALAVPWDGRLRRFQDFDWFLRLAAAGTTFLLVPEPLCIWYFRHDRETIGSRHATNWRQALEWIDERRELVTRRAYARWVLARVAGLAAASPEGVPVRLLWAKARKAGRPGMVDVLQFLYYSARGWLRRRGGSA